MNGLYFQCSIVPNSFRTLTLINIEELPQYNFPLEALSTLSYKSFFPAVQ